MTKKLVIGVDSSTTACKVIAWDRDGEAVAAARASYPTLQPEPGWREQDAEDWWASLCVALKQLLSQIDPRRVEALCITNQRESFVAVDQQGRPIRNAILWHDERSRKQIAFLAEKIGGDRIHRLTGKPLALTPSLPKMVWLAQHEPEVLTRTHKFLEPHAFLVHRLSGHYRTSLACADPMGLVDMQKNLWAVDLIRELDFRVDQFADLFAPGEIIGNVGSEAATETGLPAGLPIVAGAGDGQCAGLGADASGDGRAYLNLGTAVIGGAFSSAYVTDRAFRTLYAPMAGAYFLETVLRGGVDTVSWFVEKFAGAWQDLQLPVSQEEILEIAASKVCAGSQGLMLVPYWNNVMNPYWDPAATGITIGWTSAHGREHFYRALMEGIAFEQRLVGDAVMAAIGQHFSEYMTMGGGSRSKLWCQILADITGVPLLRSKTTEATCLGSAMLAAAAVGWYPDARAAAGAMSSTADRFLPNPEMQAIYEPLYSQVYKPLFPTLQLLVDRLSELSQGF